MNKAKIKNLLAAAAAFSVCLTVSAGAFAETGDGLEEVTAEGEVTDTVVSEETAEETASDELDDPQLTLEDVADMSIEECIAYVDALNDIIDSNTPDFGVYGYEMTEIDEAVIDRVLAYDAQMNEGCEQEEVAELLASPYSTNYYYDQLTSAQKAAYDALDAACASFLTSSEDLSTTTVKRVTFSALPSATELKQVYWTFYYSNPQYFFLPSSYSYSTAYSAITLKTFDNCRNGADKLSIKASMDSTTSSWISQANKYSNELDKETKLIRLLCDHVDYTYTDHDQSMMGAIYDGECVCNGYAMAMTYLGNAVGIPTITVTSYDHAWNRMCINGTWYEVDPTWYDDTDYPSDPYDTIWNTVSTATLQSNDGQGAHYVEVDEPMYNNIVLPSCVVDGGEGDFSSLIVPGSITCHPIGWIVYPGETAIFSIETSGSVDAYQWQFKKKGGTTWYNSGATGAKTRTLTISNANTGLNGYSYRCAVKLTDGTWIFSDVAQLTVASPFTAQPAAKTVYAGQSVSFSVTPAVSVASYQWQFKKSGGTTWYNSSATGAKTSTLTISNANTGLNGYSYRCAVKLADGTWLFSDGAKLTVNAAFTTQPAAKTVYAGEPVTFSATPAVSVASYQWQFKKSGGTTWYNSSATGAKTAALKISSANTGLNGYSYRCAVKTTSGTWLFSNGAALTVNGSLISSQPSAVSVSAGSNAKFSITTSGTVSAYQWQFSKDGGSTWINSGATGAKTATLTISSANTGLNGYYYRCAVKTTNGNWLFSNGAKLTVV